MTTDPSRAASRAFGGALTIVAVFVGVLFLNAYLCFSQGYVLSRLWAWHAVPLGATAVSWQTCTGLSLAWQMLRAKKHHPPDDPNKTQSTKAVELVVHLVVPWFVLATGWVLR